MLLSKLQHTVFFLDLHNIGIYKIHYPYSNAVCVKYISALSAIFCRCLHHMINGCWNENVGILIIYSASDKSFIQMMTLSYQWYTYPFIHFHLLPFFYSLDMISISMSWCKKDATPLRQEWSYVSFALTHRSDLWQSHYINECKKLLKFWKTLI